MEQVFYGGYEISTLSEMQNSTGQALINLFQLVMLWAEARPVVISRGPFQPKLLCDSIRLQYWSSCGATSRGQKLCTASKEAEWESQHTKEMGDHWGMSLTLLEQFWILRQQQDQSIIFSHAVFMLLSVKFYLYFTNKIPVASIISHLIYTDRKEMMLLVF